MSAVELEGWRAAAGFEALASWARRVLNDAASAADVYAAPSVEPVPVVMEPLVAATERVMGAQSFQAPPPRPPKPPVADSFRPDFKKGGKR